MASIKEQLDEFVDGWQETVAHNKKGFLSFKKLLQSMDSVSLDFVPRQGVTYSLRAKHNNQVQRQLFVMVDVIEGEPRWLSICFYADMITDPLEKGDFVPEGLLGEDACCFDMDEYSEELAGYLEERILEAGNNALQEGS